MSRFFAYTAIAALALLLVQTTHAREEAKGFDVQKLAPGVYAVIRTEPPGFAVDANNVFIINDHDVVVVDANGSVASSRAVLAALKALTDLPVRYVVNTHWHDDHILGNQVYRDAFPGVEFIAHARTREYLPGKGLEARKQAFAGVPQFLDMLRGSLSTNKSLTGAEMTPEERAAFESDIRIGERYLDGGPTAEIVLPTITIEDRLTLVRGDRVIDIRYLGRGHTSGDIVVHLPKEGIVCTGDLVVWPVPLVGSDQSHVTDWSATLGRVLDLHPTVIVPGHGPVMRDETYPRLMAALFQSITEQVTAAVTRGEDLDATRKSVNLDEFKKKFAGDSVLRRIVFANYVTYPAVESAFRDVAAKE